MNLLTLLKIDFKIKLRIIFNSNNHRFKCGLFTIIFLLFIIPSEIFIIDKYHTLQTMNSEIVIFNILLTIYVLSMIILGIIGICNNFFFENNILEIGFYPLSSNTIFFSKFIMEYIKLLFPSMIIFIFLITYGVLSAYPIIYYFKLLFFLFIFPLLVLVAVLNILMFILKVLNLKLIFTIRNLIFYISTFINLSLCTYLILKANANFFQLPNYIFDLCSTNNHIFIYCCLVNILASFFIYGDIYRELVLNSSRFRWFNSKSSIILKFKSNKTLFSCIKRELLEIFRTPILLFNVAFNNIIFSIIFLILNTKLLTTITSIEFFSIFIIVLIAITISGTSSVSNLGFSRESNNIYYLNYLPLKIETLFFSKIFIAVFLNIPIILFMNVFLISSVNTFFEIIIVNILFLLILSSFTFTNLISDFNCSSKSILTLSELFNDLELILKPMIKNFPIAIIYILNFLFITKINCEYEIKFIFFYVLNFLPLLFLIWKKYQLFKKLE